MKNMKSFWSSITVLACLTIVAGAAVTGFADRPATVHAAQAQPTPKPAGSAKATAAAEFKRLVLLKTALEKIPMDKLNREPHKSFIRKNRRDIVYSDPAGQWFVRSDRFWDLSAKYRRLPIADDIAWAAADNPRPGECEGYLNCYVYNIRETYGQYLSLYPEGKNAPKALAAIIEGFDYIVQDLNGKKGTYEGPVDAADRAGLAKVIAEMRVILSKVNAAERSKVISQLDTIGDAFK